MKIYTRTGDEGQTGLFGGPRVAKDNPRIEAYGTVDELNAVLGIARSLSPPQEIEELLARVQHELFHVGAELATPRAHEKGTAVIAPAHITALEHAIDHFEAQLQPLREFILPGGTPLAAQLHLARTVCRRAERRLVSLYAQETDSQLSEAQQNEPQPSEAHALHLLIYLNRLSDLLFVIARAANHAAGQADVAWKK